MSPSPPTVFFFNQQTGAYVGSGAPDQDPLDKHKWLIPAGATLVEPPAEREGFVRRFVDGSWGYSPKTRINTPPTPATVITPEMVIVERKRRLATGFDYDFRDARGVHRIGTTEEDLAGWDEVTKLAQAAGNVGRHDLQIAVVTDTGPVSVTPEEWQYVLLAAAEHRQPIFAASFALQAMNPIPLDYAADKYWP